MYFVISFIKCYLWYNIIASYWLPLLLLLSSYKNFFLFHFFSAFIIETSSSQYHGPLNTATHPHKQTKRKDVKGKGIQKSTTDYITRIMIVDYDYRYNYIMILVHLIFLPKIITIDSDKLNIMVIIIFFFSTLYFYTFCTC